MKTLQRYNARIFKHKSLTLLIVLMISFNYIKAQTNTLPPIGNVGIGTTTPSANLDVVGSTNLGGNVIIDSVVVVKDSATFQKKLTVNQDLKIIGTSVFVDNANFRSDLKVLGVAKMKDKLVVDGLTRLNGDANVFGDFRIKSLADSNSTSERWLTINPNGKVTSLDRIGFVSAIYDPQLPCLLLPNNQLPSPIWSAIPGVLYTGLGCPASVGIGTDNPAASLDVRGTGYFSSFFGINTVPSNQYQLYINNSVGTTAGIYLNTNHPQGWPHAKYGFQNVVNNSNTIAYAVTDVNTSQDVFVVKGDGKTGIGTANPEDDLQIRSGSTKLVVGSSGGHDLGYGTSYIGFNASRQNGSTWQTSDDTQHNGGSVIYGDIFGSIIFSTIPTEPSPASGGQTNIPDATIKTNTRLFIHKDGNVGIGTTAVNGAKLSVEGVIRARRVNVDAASIVWSDFVFEPNYNLMSLIQLENFIVKNKHLPDVPSASEVKEKGIDLAQMDAILLQKIEELTLYIIELKKEMNKLKEEQKKQ